MAFGGDGYGCLKRQRTKRAIEGQESSAWNGWMGQTFEPYQPDQSLLFPPSPKDWLPEDHLPFFVSETVEQLDLSAFYARSRVKQVS